MNDPYYAMWILQKEQIAKIYKNNRLPEGTRRIMADILADMAILEAEVILEK